ncbi:MAG TPA: hypothetical protein VI300_30680 [Solirubrobacter sp.]
MKTLLSVAVLVAVLAGCGGDEKKAQTPPAPTAGAPPRHADPDLAGYSQGVKDYYVEIHNEPTGDAETDVETEYHQPPRPAEAGVGETITLTGTNIGIRLRVTVTKVETVGPNVAVRLKLENTGITVYEAPLRQAALTFGSGAPVPVAVGASAECSNGFEAETLRLDVARKTSGCLLFPAPSGGEAPTRFQLALEIVPTEAGGIWSL